MQPKFDLYFRTAERALDRFGYRFRPNAEPFYSLANLIPYHWRSDARYFLAMNLNEMVIAPYQAVGREDGPSEDVFLEMLHDDVGRIVDRAEGIAKERGRDYVSATAVAIAMGQLADDLKTTSLQIWGPE